MNLLEKELIGIFKKPTVLEHITKLDEYIVEKIKQLYKQLFCSEDEDVLVTEVARKPIRFDLNPTFAKVVSLKKINKKTNETTNLATFWVPIPVYKGKIGYMAGGTGRIPVYLVGDAPIHKRLSRVKSRKSLAITIENVFLRLHFNVETLQSYERAVYSPNMVGLLPLKYDSVEEMIEDLKLTIKKDKTVEVREDSPLLHWSGSTRKMLTQRLRGFLTSAEQPWYQHGLSEGFTFRELYFTHCFVGSKSVAKSVAPVRYLITKDPCLAGYYHDDNTDGYSIVDLIYFLTVEHAELFETFRHKVVPLINDMRLRRLKLTDRHVRKLFKNVTSKFQARVAPDIPMQTMSSTSYYALDNSVNPIHQISLATRASPTGPDGIPDRRATDTLRNLHASYFGIIDPIDTPSGLKVGLSQHVSPDADVSASGLIRVGKMVINRLPLVDLPEEQLGMSRVVGVESLSGAEEEED